MESTALSRRAEILSDTVRKLVRRGARANLSRMLSRLRPEDVAVLLHGLTPAEQLAVFQILISDYPEGAGKVVTQLEPAQRLALLEQLSAEQTASILELIPVDDAVYVVESLPADLQEKVLDLVDLRELSDVQAHLTYRDDSAGRIMDSEFFALPESTTAAEAIAEIQKQRDIEMIFYLYVVDRDGHLVGVTSLRQLLLSPPEQTLGEIMNRSLVKVHTETDQEEVAQLAARYDLLAIPVTDETNRLVGIVTVDDIIDILKEEATEDFLKMVGTSEDELLYQERSLKVAKIRLPWLVVTLLGLVLSGIALRYFQVQLKEALFLLIFVPVIMGMGGNIGVQTSTIAVRGLATGRIGPGQGRIRRFLLQQLKVGALLGFFCAVTAAAAAGLLEANLYYGIVVGVALLLAIVLSSLIGALIPLLARRLGLDPAAASGPLVTTCSDITGIVIYFGLASWLIDWLLRSV